MGWVHPSLMNATLYGWVWGPSYRFMIVAFVAGCGGGRCPFPDCDIRYDRIKHVKRHLKAKEAKAGHGFGDLSPYLCSKCPTLVLEEEEMRQHKRMNKHFDWWESNFAPQRGFENSWRSFTGIISVFLHDVNVGTFLRWTRMNPAFLSADSLAW